MTTAPGSLEDDLERWDDNMKRWAARTARSIRRRAEAGTLPQLSPDLPGESWRPVVGAPDYQVSDQGRVRFMGKLEPHYRAAQDLRLNPGSHGYLQVSIGGRHHLVHRLVLEAFHGPGRCTDQVARHLDGDPWNNAATNLAHGTHAENVADAVRHGTRKAAVHGTKAKYSAGCRCEGCRQAVAAWHRARMADPKRRAAKTEAQRARRAAKRATQERTE